MNFSDEKFIQRLNDYSFSICQGFVPNMKVPVKFYANDNLQSMIFDELDQYRQAKGIGGFLPAVTQLANVASLPGIVGNSIGLPDLHSGYGFAIGNVAAMDMSDENAVVSPGGVGFDINCGVRLIRTNLMESDITKECRDRLALELYNDIPVGVGTRGKFGLTGNSIDEVLNEGIDYSIRNGLAWEEDKENCEENGRMSTANAKKVSERAKKRGIPQMGTLGAGNHYLEVQVVDEIFDTAAAKTMDVEQGSVCVMIHSGSRGLGHQVATDSLKLMEQSISSNEFNLNDRQLACAKITSQPGQDYLAAMSSAANFAWANRQAMTYQTRKVFEKVFQSTADDLQMNLVYDTSHNIAKIEKHIMPDGREAQLLVHRKGSTRAFGPGNPFIPLKYQNIGQPVLIGGTMGTSSYVLTGTEVAMRETFGSTCHGAGRLKSRHSARKEISYSDVLRDMSDKGISVCVAAPEHVSEEAPSSYKDVDQVIETCHAAGISRKAFRLKPIAVIKG